MQGNGRVVSIDFWRGFALLTIFINHIPGHILGGYTYRNFGISDAAELFVLLAGISAAFAYMRGFVRGTRLRITAKIWLRAFQLYVAHLALLLLAIAVIGGFVVMTGDSRVLDGFHLNVIVERPVEALVGMALLTYQPAYLNILPLYVSILLLAPLLIALMHRSLPLGLGFSLSLYLLNQVAGLSLPVWPNSGDWFFNPFACLGKVEKGRGLPGLLVRLIIAPKHCIHPGLIAPALRLEPVDHIGVEHGIDVGFQRRNVHHGLGPIILSGCRVVGIRLGHGLNLRLGKAFQPLPIGAVFRCPRGFCVWHHTPSFLHGLPGARISSEPGQPVG